MKLTDLYSRLSPVLSLASGVLTVTLVQRGAEYAPVVALLLLAAWATTTLVHRFLPAHVPLSEGQLPRGGTRAVWHLAGRGAAVGLYQSTLFFLLPLWFESMVWPSTQVVFVAVLALVALASCFDGWFHREVLGQRTARAALTAFLLFCAVVPIAPALLHWPLRLSTALAAALSAAITAVVQLRARRLAPTPIAAWTAVVALCFALGYAAAPLLPPVPFACKTATAATSIAQRMPVGATSRVPDNAPSVYAYFAVAAPRSFTQPVRFQWHLEGQAIGLPISASIVGGRKDGFRTWTFRHRPARGRYRVDLLSGDDQLLGRVLFDVERASRRN